MPICSHSYIGSVSSLRLVAKLGSPFSRVARSAMACFLQPGAGVRSVGRRVQAKVQLQCGACPGALPSASVTVSWVDASAPGATSIWA